MNSGVFPMHRRHPCGDPAAHVEIADHFHPAGLTGFDEVIQNHIGDFFIEGPLVAEGPEVEFEGFKLDAESVGHIPDPDCRKIRLTRLGAEAGEFGTNALNFIIAFGLGVGKSL